MEVWIPAGFCLVYVTAGKSNRNVVEILIARPHYYSARLSSHALCTRSVCTVLGRRRASDRDYRIRDGVPRNGTTALSWPPGGRRSRPGTRSRGPGFATGRDRCGTAQRLRLPRPAVERSSATRWTDLDLARAVRSSAGLPDRRKPAPCATRRSSRYRGRPGGRSRAPIWPPRTGAMQNLPPPGPATSAAAPRATRSVTVCSIRATTRLAASWCP